MKKNLTIFLLACIIFGGSNQVFADSVLQPIDNVETSSTGGLGDVGPPHQDTVGKK